MRRSQIPSSDVYLQRVRAALDLPEGFEPFRDDPDESRGLYEKMARWGQEDMLGVLPDIFTALEIKNRAEETEWTPELEAEFPKLLADLHRRLRTLERDHLEYPEDKSIVAARRNVAQVEYRVHQLWRSYIWANANIKAIDSVLSEFVPDISVVPVDIRNRMDHFARRSPSLRVGSDNPFSLSPGGLLRTAMMAAAAD